MQIACTEIHNEENPLAGKASFARKPKIIEGFILDKNNVYKLCGFLTKQLKGCNFYPYGNSYESYKTKSHTRVELGCNVPRDTDVYNDLHFWFDIKVGEIVWVEFMDNRYSIKQMDFKEFQKDYDLIEGTR